MNRNFILGSSSFIVVLAIALVVYLSLQAEEEDMNLRAQLHTGEVASLSELPGRLRLVYFGYLNCPDVCLTASQSIGSALKNLEAADPESRAQVTNVFITLDPSDDVIEGVYNELEGYMDLRYGGQGYAMRPEDKAAAARMAALFGIRFEYTDNDFFPQGYQVDHSSRIFLTDQYGQVLAFYADRTPGRVIASEVLRYLERLSS